MPLLSLLLATEQFKSSDIFGHRALPALFVHDGSASMDKSSFHCQLAGKHRAGWQELHVSRSQHLPWGRSCAHSIAGLHASGPYQDPNSPTVTCP